MYIRELRYEVAYEGIPYNIMKGLQVTERFAIVNEEGSVTGSATRTECHGGSHYLHPVVHVLVFDGEGRLAVQQRSFLKDIQPGKWDTSVGGHVQEGEKVADALVREAREELGIDGAKFGFLYRYIMTSDIERELVWTYRCRWDKPFVLDEAEVSDVRLLEPSEVDAQVGSGWFTPNFEDEWRRYRVWQSDIDTSDDVIPVGND